MTIFFWGEKYLSEKSINKADVSRKTSISKSILNELNKKGTAK